MELARFAVIAAFWGIVGWVVLVNLFSSVSNAASIIDRGETLPRIFKLPLYVGYGIGLVLDAIFNFIGGTFIFGEAPRQWTFSSRVQGYINQAHGRRREKALWWAEQLNKFDRGHIKLPAANKAKNKQ